MVSIGALAIVFAAVAAAWLYNHLVRGRNRVDTAWSDIDVQLQRRHDLIPSLVKAVDQYASYERATLEGRHRIARRGNAHYRRRRSAPESCA